MWFYLTLHKNVSSLYKMKKCGKEFQTMSEVTVHMQEMVKWWKRQLDQNKEELQDEETSEANITFNSINDETNFTQCVNENPAKIINEDANKIIDKLLIDILNGLEISEKEKSTYCEICDRVFSNKSSLKRHVDNVHRQIKFKCDKCNENFSLKENLKKHIVTTHKGKKYKCIICSKIFSRSEHLKRHNDNIHIGSKDYHNCESCGKSFTNSDNLKRHTYIVHYGQKDYNCNNCGKLFVSLQNLKRHINSIHSG